MDINELKVQHYRERVTDYEDQIATLRAQLTLVTQERDQLAAAQESEPEPEPAPQTPRRPRG